MKGLLTRYGVTPSSAFGRSAQVQVVDMRKSDIRYGGLQGYCSDECGIAGESSCHQRSSTHISHSRRRRGLIGLHEVDVNERQTIQPCSAAAKLVSLSDSPMFSLGPLEWTTNYSAELRTRRI
jgi:hypothetical protein